MHNNWISVWNGRALWHLKRKIRLFNLFKNLKCARVHRNVSCKLNTFPAVQVSMVVKRSRIHVNTQENAQRSAIQYQYGGENRNQNPNKTTGNRPTNLFVVLHRCDRWSTDQKWSVGEARVSIHFRDELYNSGGCSKRIVTQKLFVGKWHRRTFSWIFPTRSNFIFGISHYCHIQLPAIGIIIWTPGKYLQCMWGCSTQVFIDLFHFNRFVTSRPRRAFSHDKWKMWTFLRNFHKIYDKMDYWTHCVNECSIRFD